MKAFVGFLLGIIVAVFAIWLLDRDPNTRNEIGDGIDQAGREMKEGARDLADEVQDGAESIDTERIKENVEEVGDKIAEASSDAVITGTIKAKYATDPQVSALSIDVDTTDGLVTLSGRVSSQGEVDRAVQLARGVDGVRDVVSALQIAQL